MNGLARRFLLSQVISLAGDNVTPALLALAVIGAGHGAGTLSLVLASSLVPKLAMFAMGGVLGDTRDRLTMMRIAGLLAGAAQIVTAVGLWRSWPIGVVVVAQAGYGLAVALMRPAATSYLPTLVGDGALLRANSILGSASGVCAVAGPFAATGLVLLASPTTGLAIDGLTFLVSTTLLSGLPASRGVMGARRGATMLLEGLTELLRRRWLSAEAVASALLALMVTTPFFILGPQLTTQMGGEAAWPLALGAYGVGQFVGGTVGGIGVGRPLMIAGVGMIVLGAPPLVLVAELGLPALLAAQLGVGVALGYYHVVVTTAIQRDVPGELLGRVTSVNYLASFGIAPLGYITTPLIAAWLGTSAPLIGAVIGALLVAAILLSARSFRQFTLQDAHVASGATP